uniref:MFS transporter n=1 Tax=Streptomyces atratus TaxID=1893 RepID=UPI002F912CEC
MTHTNSPARPVARIPARAVTAVVGLLVFFELTSGVLQAGITPLLPDLAVHLGIGTADTNWIISVQLLAAAVCVPLFGRLGDLYGHRRMLRIALVVTAAGTLIVALADSYPVLLAGRLLQGPLAALLPLEIALVRDRLPVAEARRAIALLVGSLALGSLVGGLALALVHSASGDLRLTLLLPAALALVCVPVSYVAVPESAHRASGRVDWPGVSLLSAAVLALLSGVGAAKNGAWGQPGGPRPSPPRCPPPDHLDSRGAARRRTAGGPPGPRRPRGRPLLPRGIPLRHLLLRQPGPQHDVLRRGSGDGRVRLRPVCPGHLTCFTAGLRRRRPRLLRHCGGRPADRLPSLN